MRMAPTLIRRPAPGNHAWGVRPRLTVRVRLTLLYGGMFLLAGTVLIILLYLGAQATLFSDNLGFVRVSQGPDGDAIREVTQTPPGSQGDLPTGDLDKRMRETFNRARDVSLSAMLQQSLLALGLVTVAATGFGWMMAGRVLRPLKRITETARRVADRSLHERIDLQGPQDELKELADTFDAMLGRLDRSFDSQRQFVANASHELRTPLAINRTLLEVAFADGKVPPELRPMVTALLATNERNERLIDGLLTLARSESQVVRRRPVDLSDIAAAAVEQTAGEAAAAEVDMDVTPNPAPTSGDPSLLERLALNLVRNAIRHNHPGGWLEVNTGPDRQRGWVRLVVSNTGPEVPPYDLEALFEPFRQRHGDQESGDPRGAGLGLSIVRSVAQTHGGMVHAAARAGGGLTVTVRLPAVEEQPAALPALETSWHAPLQPATRS